MILEIDVGNTRTKWRIKDQQRIVSRGVQATADISNALQIDMSVAVDLSSAVMSCVADCQLRNGLIRQLETRFGIKTKIAVVSERVGSVECGYETFGALGIDRWLAILAGFQRIAGAMVVIDAGSALTVDFVDELGKHKGGYIVPGISMMRHSLSKGAEGIRLCSCADDDPRFPGFNTGEAVSKGCLLSSVSLIKYLSEDQSSTLVMTGGDAKLLLQYLGHSPVYVEDLVLEGLSVAGVQFKTL